MAHHIGLQVLRAKIRGFQATGQTITARIAKAEKERKNKLWEAKRKLGTHCRHHLIAYGLLRGIPYERIERCAENNRPDAKRVLEIVLEHNGMTPFRTWRDAAGKPQHSGGGRRDYDLESVKAYLLQTSAKSSTQASPATLQTPPPGPTAPRILPRLRELFLLGPRAAHRRDA